MESNPLTQLLNKRSEEASKWLNLISQMTNDERYSYASDTLDGIYDYVADNGQITENQKQAVQNIRDKPSQNYGRKRYRR